MDSKSRKKVKTARPMAALFSSSGFLHNNPSITINYTKEGKQFKKIFGDDPTTFIQVGKEVDLKHRCMKHGITYIPPKASDSVEASAKRKSKLNSAIDDTFPMSAIFSPSGSMYESNATEVRAIELSYKGLRFKDVFKSYLSTFICLEERLEKRCKENGVLYISPRPRDSLDDTLRRKEDLRKAIAAARRQKQ